MSAPEKTKERERLERWTAQNPRDELALAMFAAWVNCSVDKLPPEMRGHTCAATMAAWSRVADIPAARIAELEAEVEAYREMHAEMNANGGPNVIRLQMQARRDRIRAEKAEAESARFRALLDAHDALVRGEPSRPPRAALNKDRAP